ncbi:MULTISPECIES: C40 family peptidase [unclassified Streptomyces]|uniref:C40 family peptidase n=1 Tax=unclassified Streptomyces TaxID=2593676 RepID=UPI003B638D81
MKISRMAIAILTLLVAVTAQIQVSYAASPAEPSRRAAPKSLSVRALDVAISKKGFPYQYGATGPRRFDCSGLMQYSFRVAGRRIPRTAEQQFHYAHHVPATHRKRGDLVFFLKGRNVYHVGFYAGAGKIWHAPKPNRKIRVEKIWTRNVRYGRVS